jgi:hypothetical protein
MLWAVPELNGSVIRPRCEVARGKICQRLRLLRGLILGQPPRKQKPRLVGALGERPGLENLNSATAKLGEALGDRRILLVIDDAWREQDLRPFSHGGANTTRLITTRLSKIMPQDAQKQQVVGFFASSAQRMPSK